nr:alpha/beta hydrolase [Clostridia bacterium]
MKNRYPYSIELKGSAFNTDYDMSELALNGKMDMVIRFISNQSRKFKSKKCHVKSGTYESSDKAEVTYYEFTPLEQKDLYPAIVYYHGGGFMFPIQKMMMEMSSIYASECGVKVFLPEYRFVPKVSCDQVMDDCYEMLKYVFDNAEQLHVDPNKVILYGDSAGGCLAACTALRNRDSDTYPIKAQMLIYPVTDNESENYDSMDTYEYAVWSRKANLSMWKLYFHNGYKDIRNLVPMKNDTTNLPKAYVEPQECDVLRDEAIAYANKLKKAGVEVECNLIGGSYHGFDSEFKSRLVKETICYRCDYIKKQFE